MKLANKISQYRKKLVDIASKREKVCIQVPAGLKKEAISIANFMKRKGVDSSIISEPSYGACDLAINQAETLNCDCLLHLGHSIYYKNGEKIGQDLPVYHLETKLEREIKPILETEIDKIEETRLGIIGTIQHLGQLEEIKQILQENDKHGVIGKKGTKTKNKGQILGCDNSSAAKIKDEVEAFLVFASGKFHAQKVLELGKKVYRLDAQEQRIETLTSEISERRKKQRISKVLKHKEEKNWGILASTKPGQYFPKKINEVRNKLENLGKDVKVFGGNRIMEQDLIGFGIKIWVNTACPRLTDDFEQITVINPEDLQLLKQNNKEGK